MSALTTGVVASSVVTTFPVAQLTGDFLTLAIVFFVLAVLAAVVGASGIAGISMQIAKILIAVFIILAIISLLL